MNIFEEVREFYLRYRGEKRVIGYSEEGREIFAMLAGGQGYPLGISQAAMHAREWVTALLSLEQLRLGVKRGGVWVIPLVNPDGVLLATEGIKSVSAARRDRLSALNGGDDFSLWKANADGVDLNVNFDAAWGTGRRNVRAPAAENYIGRAPFCAKESAALRDFTLSVRPDFTVSWHTKGEEIYWKFAQPLLRRLRDGRRAKILSEATGYPLKSAPHSAGGYKDWCVQALQISAFTVEAGADRLAHPLGREELPDLLKHGLNALCALTEGF